MKGAPVRIWLPRAGMEACRMCSPLLNLINFKFKIIIIIIDYIYKIIIIIIIITVGCVLLCWISWIFVIIVTMMIIIDFIFKIIININEIMDIIMESAFLCWVLLIILDSHGSCEPPQKQVRKARRCDSYLQSETINDWLTDRGRC